MGTRHFLFVYVFARTVEYWRLQFYAEAIVNFYF